jgi:HK97 family phage major capsid protein
LTALRADFGGMRGLLDTLNTEVTGLKSENATLKSENADALAKLNEVRERLARGEGLGGSIVQRTPNGRFVPQVSRECGEWAVKVFRAYKNPDSSIVRELGATGTGPDGGYLVPVAYRSELLSIITSYGQYRANARVVPMEARTVQFPAFDAGMTVSWPNENSAIGESQPTFLQTTLNAKTVAALTHASHQLIQAATPAITGIILDAAGRALAKEEDRVGFTGSTGAGDPYNGLLYAANVNDVVMSTGKTAFTQVTADNLLDLVDAVETGALANAKFYLHRTVLSVIKKLKDANGNYIWQAPNGNEPGTIWGYPYVLIEAMPKVSDTAVSKPFVLFGNMLYTMLGDLEALQADVSEHFAFNKLQTFFRFFEQIAVTVSQPKGFSRLKTAAS